MLDEHRQNKEAWNEAAAYYRNQLPDEVHRLRTGQLSLCPAELSVLAPLIKQTPRCIHLQCAGGTDTLSLLQLGAAEVVGIDISEEMIEVARSKSAALQLPATWVVADVLHVPDAYRAYADLVYTGKGAINWIANIEAWAIAVSQLIRPSGYFYIFDGHPVTFFFRMQANDLIVDPEFPGYFADAVYTSDKWPETYVGQLKPKMATKHEKAWPVSRVITALIDAGLTLKQFTEHPDPYWQEFPNMPDPLRRKFPNTFSLLMQK